MAIRELCDANVHVVTSVWSWDLRVLVAIWNILHIFFLRPVEHVVRTHRWCWYCTVAVVHAGLLLNLLLWSGGSWIVT